MPFRLVVRNLLAHPLRAILTLLTLVVAVFLLCFLQSLLISLNAGVEGASSERLVVQSAVSLFVDLPLSYQGKLEGVPGVDNVCKLQYFGGSYKDSGGYFAQFGVDPDRYFDCYPEVQLLEGTEEQFRVDRTACIIGRSLSRRFGWKLGDTVPLVGTIFPRLDGSTWDFKVAGIYRSDGGSVDEATMIFHFDYLRESIETGGSGGGEGGEAGVGVYTIKLADGVEPTTVMREIDALFENGPQRVQATTEAEFNRQFVSMLGNVPKFLAAIGGGVLFAIALAALNTMLMAGRERTHDIGILKALGFSNGKVAALMLVESMTLCGLGGILGVAFVKTLEETFAGFLSNQFPGFAISPQIIAIGLGSALAIGMLAGIVPAWNAGRMRPVRALRGEG